jgi:hypothetical protein
MKFMLRQSILLLGSVLLLSAIAFAQQIPVGTVLPIMSNGTLDSRKSKPGEKLTGRLMQDVVLPSGVLVRSGAKIEGQVLESSQPAGPTGARLILRFERLVSGGRQFSISVSLLALASMQDVFEAQLPVSNFDEYGTSSSDWTTVQVGGRGRLSRRRNRALRNGCRWPCHRLWRGHCQAGSGSKAGMPGDSG